MDKKNIIAQWAFDTRSILGRLHLWLEDVEEVWEQQKVDDFSFVEPGLERALVMTAAVTALGGKLFGRYGDGKDAAKRELNQVKKDADAITAYVMSESLWYLSRSLPENHAIMVCLGEGLMPKVGETPEMGSNPLLGFGRIYARPQVAKFLEEKVKNLINNDDYTWDKFYRDIKKSNITIWGAAIDTLENTSRFAKGKESGPLTIIHIFDQPLCMTKPYEGYMGNLILPGEVQRNAQKNSLLLNFFTPRDKVLDMILHSYPGLKAQNVHVWTLRGESREKRIGSLWKIWENLGAHLVDNDWKLPSEHNAFTDSGTYKPCFMVKHWTDSAGEQHVFICDGYAASAEAVQAASLSPLLDIHASIALFSSKFELSYEEESQVMHLNPESPHFTSHLEKLFAKKLPSPKIEEYKNYIYQAKNAGIPMNVDLQVSDFFPEKIWRVMGICGYILPDPYTGAEGVEQIADNIYRVTVRLATKKGCKVVKISLRLQKTVKESQLVFNPLLTRFMNGENYKERAVKVSDSGRIRNELQTLCSEALEYLDNGSIKIYFDRIPVDVIARKKQTILKEVLTWYRHNHPIWFRWLQCEQEYMMEEANEHSPVMQKLQLLEQNVNKVIVGKPKAVRLALITLLCKGHLLLEDVPGVGKTVLAKAIAKSISAKFNRIQFTPDLLPNDVTGVSIFNQKNLDFEFRQGPIFANIILGDEINRATPRTQSSLLECMEERQVTIDGETHVLPELFFVIATQNPVEQHGTFPLPEAQLDRFFMCIQLGYPSERQEIAILNAQIQHHPLQDITPVITAQEIHTLQQQICSIHISDSVKAYLVAIVRATRESKDISLGASPRASLALMRACQAHALFNGKEFVTPQMVKELAIPILCHRIIANPQAHISGLNASKIIHKILNSVVVPLDEDQ